jgi:hypothetical protein
MGVMAVERSENPGVPVLFGGHNLPPLVEIGSTDLQKSGGAGGARDNTSGLGRHCTVQSEKCV